MKQEKTFLNSEKSDIKENLWHYHADLLRFLNSQLHNREVAEDLVQDCMLQAYTRFLENKYTEQRALKSYLFCLAYSRLIDYFRKNKTQLNKLAVGSGEIRRNLGWEQSNVEDEDLKQERYFSVERMIKTGFEDLPISIAQKRVLELRYIENLCFKDIAMRLDAPISTVISRHHYAVLSIRTYYNSKKMHKNNVPLRL